jgi:hypothetical protein
MWVALSRKISGPGTDDVKEQLQYALKPNPTLQAANDGQLPIC